MWNWGIVELQCDKCSYCESLWTKASAKRTKCKCKWKLVLSLIKHEGSADLSNRLFILTIMVMSRISKTRNLSLFADEYFICGIWTRQRLCLRGEASVLLSEGCWFNSPGLAAEESLGKVLNPEAGRHLARHPPPSVCVNIWILVSHSGKNPLLNALNLMWTVPLTKCCQCLKPSFF